MLGTIHCSSHLAFLFSMICWNKGWFIDFILNGFITSRLTASLSTGASVTTRLNSFVVLFYLLKYLVFFQHQIRFYTLCGLWMFLTAIFFSACLFSVCFFHLLPLNALNKKHTNEHINRWSYNLTNQMVWFSKRLRLEESTVNGWMNLQSVTFKAANQKAES